MKYIFVVIAFLFGLILKSKPLANVSYLNDDEISYRGGLNQVIFG